MKRLLAICLFLLLPVAAQATVSSTSTSVTYTCSGSVGPYAFTFPISAPAALSVIQNGTTIASTAYTIAPVNNNYANGGSVTLNAACSVGQTLVLQRITPLTQASVFTDNMPVPMKTFERGLDKLTEIDQEIQQTITCPNNQFLHQISIGPGVSVCATPIGISGPANGTPVINATLAAYAGADMVASINNAISAANVEGGVPVDARGFVCPTNCQIGSANLNLGDGTHPVTLYLPAGNIAIGAGKQIKYNWYATLIGQGAKSTLFKANQSSPVFSPAVGGLIENNIYSDFAVENDGTGGDFDWNSVSESYMTRVAMTDSPCTAHPHNFPNVALVLGGGGSYYNHFYDPLAECSGIQLNINANSNTFEGGKLYRVVVNDGQSNTFNHLDIELGSGLVVLSPTGTEQGTAVHDAYLEQNSTLTPGAWVAANAYYLGDKVTDGSAGYFVCTVAGTSQTPGPPSWVETIGAATTDGGVTWEKFSPYAPPYQKGVDNADIIFGLNTFGNVLDGVFTDPGFVVVADLTGGWTNKYDFQQQTYGQGPWWTTGIMGLAIGGDNVTTTATSDSRWLFQRSPGALTNGYSGYGLELDMNQFGTECVNSGYCGFAPLYTGSFQAIGSHVISGPTVIQGITPAAPKVYAPLAVGGDVTTYSFRVVERPAGAGNHGGSIYSAVSPANAAFTTGPATPSAGDPVYVCMSGSANSKWDILENTTNSYYTNVVLTPYAGYQPTSWGVGGCYAITAALPGAVSWTHPNTSNTLTVPGLLLTGTSANTDLAGTLTMSTGSKSYTWTGTYSVHPSCTANDETSIAAVQVSYTSTTSVTFTTSGASDVIDYVCVARN